MRGVVFFNADNLVYQNREAGGRVEFDVRRSYVAISPSVHVGFYRLVLEYWCWYTANIVNISVFNALSIGSGLVAAEQLCTKREAIISHAWSYRVRKNEEQRLFLSGATIYHYEKTCKRRLLEWSYVFVFWLLQMSMYLDLGSHNKIWSISQHFFFLIPAQYIPTEENIITW